MRRTHEYDATLKKILTRPDSVLLRTLTGSASVHWLNVELHRGGSLRVDLLGMTPSDELIHLEFQSNNQKLFWARVGEYGFAISRHYGRYPKQIVVYTGQKPLRMPSHAGTPDFHFRFHMIDIRDLDTEALLASGNPSDNVIAILTRNGGEKQNVRRVLEKIAAAQAKEREEALAELIMIAGLRDLGTTIEREVKRMPILNDIMDHDFLGPKLRQAHAEGREEGRDEGREEGREEGELSLLLLQAERRFGAIPPAIRKRVEALKSDGLRQAGLRLLDASRIEDLFVQ